MNTQITKDAMAFISQAAAEIAQELGMTFSSPASSGKWASDNMALICERASSLQTDMLGKLCSNDEANKALVDGMARKVWRKHNRSDA